MSNLSCNVKNEISNICYAIVSGHFADMVNSENRGKNFTWNNFSNGLSDRCEYELHMYIKVPQNDTGKEMRLMAKQYGKEIADRLVKRSGFLK